MSISDDLRHSYSLFENDWLEQLRNKMNDEEKADAFENSYVRIASIQSWKSIIETIYSSTCVVYIVEAQNDLLSSLILARLGSWRVSLKSLRSSMENTAKFIYYKDHPVEQKQSEDGTYRFSFSQFLKYIEAYPYEKQPPNVIKVVDNLCREYSVLSKAVHASNARFQMSSHGPLPQMWVTSISDQSQWISRERMVINSINCLLLVMHFDLIEGTKYPEQRSVISNAISSGLHSEILTAYAVRLS